MDEGSALQSGADAQLFYDAFRASPIGIALENIEGRPLFVNAALCSLLGFSEEEIRGKQCVEFSPPEDAQKDWALFEQLRSGSIDHYELEKRFFRRDGSLVWGRLNISLLSGRAAPLVVAMVEDITERRRTQEEYAVVVETSEDAIISKSVEGVIISWNRAASRMFGYSSEEVIGRTISLIPPDLRDEETHIWSRLAAGERIDQYETRRLAKNGRTIHVSLVISPIKDAKGRITGLSKIARDITERKQAEEALSRFHQKLIEAQEQERSRLARELHDDINQKVAMLAIELERLKRGLPSSTGELEQKLEEACERVVGVGKDIQALSHRLHSPKLELLGLAATASSFCKEFSDRKKVEIDFQTENVPQDLSQDIALCLFRILQEALQNAAKHSGSRHLQVLLGGRENDIELTVQDWGVGFEPEAAAQGPGLGLTSMKERLKLVHGRLSIESKPQRGTTIHARVPLHFRARSARAIE